MKLLNKILFKPDKFTLVCYNEQEWNNTQLELFKLGYYWETDKKTIYESTWSYPRILKNYRSSDKFGSKILIIDSYDWCKNIKTTNSLSYIRKLKLQKIKNGI